MKLSFKKLDTLKNTPETLKAIQKSLSEKLIDGYCIFDDKIRTFRLENSMKR